MKISKCPACLSTHIREFLRLNNSRRSRFIEYSQTYYNGLLEQWLNIYEPVLLHCLECGHIFYQFVPDDPELSQMYSSLIRPKNSPAPNRPPSQHMLYEMDRMFKLTGKQKPTVLDYGAGYGRWSQAAVKVGFDVVSFEPHSNRASADARIDLVHSFSSLKGQVFDVILLEQVIEHVQNPQDVLCQIREFMSKDSILRVTVPNINRTREGRNIWNEWPYNGESSHVLAPYQHLHGFSHRSLSALCSSVGYRNLRGLNICIYDTVHQLRMIFGKHLDFLSTTKRYLTLPENQTY